MSSFRVFPVELVRRQQELAMRPENVLKTADPNDQPPAALFGQAGWWRFGLSVNF